MHVQSFFRGSKSLFRGSKSLLIDTKFATRYFDLRYSNSREYLLGGLRRLCLKGKV
jgi:hypothetical protein